MSFQIASMLKHVKVHMTLKEDSSRYTTNRLSKYHLLAGIAYYKVLYKQDVNRYGAATLCRPAAILRL